MSKMTRDIVKDYKFYFLYIDSLDTEVVKLLKNLRY